MEKEIIHKMPEDFKEAINSNSKIKERWKGLTSIAKNEFICQILSTKKSETREKRIKRSCEDLMNGKRRPCCWPGCPHRNPNAKKWFK